MWFYTWQLTLYLRKLGVHKPEMGVAAWMRSGSTGPLHIWKSSKDRTRPKIVSRRGTTFKVIAVWLRGNYFFIETLSEKREGRAGHHSFHRLRSVF